MKVSFEKFMELALYASDIGYYKSEKQKSARRGDYITSVEVGPLFGAVLARALDSWWEQAGKPNPFYVFDTGAGVGTLGRSILRAKPDCLASLKYVMVEQSEYLVAQQAELVKSHSDIFQSLQVDYTEAISLGEAVEHGVVIANELLDNLPVRLLEKTSDGWAEVYVSLDDDMLVLGEELAVTDLETAKRADELAPSAKAGERIPIIDFAKKWLARFFERGLGCIKQGRVVIFDYGVLTTDELLKKNQEGEKRQWLRTYTGHKQGNSPYDFIGRQDITCEVPFDQLEKISGSGFISIKTQAEFLNEWGIDELVDMARSKNKSSDEARIPTDLSAIELKSRITEAQALLDPTGLGAYMVAEVEVSFL